MKNLVYIVDVRNLIQGNKSTLERHLKYSEILDLRSKGDLSLGIIRFKRQNCITSGREDGLQVLTLPSNPLALARVLLLNKITGNQDNSVKVLVAGDPWESAISAYLLKSTYFHSAKVQVQIHGDIGNKEWIFLTFRNFLRSFTARFTLRIADQIRTVGKKQTENLISKYSVPKLKCRIIPVTSFFSSFAKISDVRNSTTAAIGFVGRLQSDRGIIEFLDLVAKLRSQNLMFSVVVAGDGPERNIFEFKLREVLPPVNIKFLGNLDHTEMGSAWSQIGILVSTAPTESYGRAIREALALGIPVWAIPSSGVSDLQREVSKLYVKDLNLELPADRQVGIFQELLSTRIPTEVRNGLMEADQKAQTALIESWIELSN
jgi:glycosyltransferase involved in cell wall biosynthesis